MAAPTDTFSTWLAQARVSEDRLTAEQRALLGGAFRFRRQQGDDYYSMRLLSHFLLHCEAGLKVAQVARLVGISRPTASRQQGLSSKEAIRQAHHRMDGRPYGKLLPRYAGAIAQFLFSRPDAARGDLLDFIDTTFGVRVSAVALHKFLKKFGLDRATLQATLAAPTPTPAPAAGSGPASGDNSGSATAADLPSPAAVPFIPQGRPIPTPAPPFSSHARTTRAPS